jgi:hypothetical protein
VKPLSPSEAVIDLQVSRSWKGTSPSHLTIWTRGTCAYEVAPGEVHLVYLEHVATEHLETSICMGNRSGADLDNLVGQLDQLKE